MTSSAALRSPQTCFRLPHCLGCFAACGFPRPPALRDADYRLPPVIVLPLWIVLLLPVMVMASSESSRSAGAGVIVLLFVVLLYIGIRDKAYPRVLLLLFYLLGIMRLLIIPAFGEILRQWCAEFSASPPLSSTHFGLQRHQGAREGKWSAAVEKPPQGRHFHLAGSIMLLYVGGAAAEEQVNKGRRYARQSRLTPPQTRILFAPIPGGVINGQAPHSESTSVAVHRDLT